MWRGELEDAERERERELDQVETGRARAVELVFAGPWSVQLYRHLNAPLAAEPFLNNTHNCSLQHSLLPVPPSLYPSPSHPPSVSVFMLFIPPAAICVPPSLRHPSLCLHLVFRPACIFMLVVNMEKGKTLVKYSNAQICSASYFNYDGVWEQRGSLRTCADLTLYIYFCDSIPTTIWTGPDWTGPEQRVSAVGYMLKSYCGRIFASKTLKQAAAGQVFWNNSACLLSQHRFRNNLSDHLHHMTTKHMPSMCMETGNRLSVIGCSFEENTIKGFLLFMLFLLSKMFSN